MVTRHDAAFFDRVIEESQSRCRAVGTAAFKAHLFQNPRNGIPLCRGWREGKIDDPERHAQPLGGFARNELPHAGDFERGLFDRFGDHVEGLALAALQRVIDHAGSADADVDDALPFADAVERTRHERVVLHRVGKNDELGAAEAAVCGGQGSGFLDRFAHQRHGVHVDPGLGAANVDARADALGRGERRRDRRDQLFVAFGKALLNKSGKAADKVDAALFRRVVHRDGDRGVVFFLARRRDERDRRDRDAFVDDRDPELFFDVFAHADEVLRRACDLLIDLFGAAVDAFVAAVEQRDAHRDRPHVQMAVLDHIKGGDNVVDIKQHSRHLTRGASA